MACCGKAQGVFANARMPEHVQNLLRRSQPAPETGAKRRFRSPVRTLQPPIAYFGPATGAMDPRYAQLGAALLPFAPPNVSHVLTQAATNLAAFASQLESAGLTAQAAALRSLVSQWVTPQAR